MTTIQPAVQLVPVQGINFTFQIDRRAAWVIIAQVALGRYDSRSALRRMHSYPVDVSLIDRIIAVEWCPDSSNDDIASTVCSVIARALLSIPAADTLLAAYHIAAQDDVVMEPSHETDLWVGKMDTLQRIKFDEVAEAELDLLYHSPQFLAAFTI